MPRIRPGHQDPLRRRTQTSAPTSASGPVTPPGHSSSSPAQLPITLYVCKPYLTTTIASPLVPPPTNQVKKSAFLAKRSGGALETQVRLVGDGSASPGGGGDDGCLVETVVLGVQVGRRSGRSGGGRVRGRRKKGVGG